MGRLHDQDLLQVRRNIKSPLRTFTDLCRWPAIIGIVVGSLIIISIIWCLVRCMCCGMSCCCSCLSCCDCGRDRNKRSKFADGPTAFQSAPYQGYQPTPAPPSYETPRFATFDAPTKNGKFNADALPAMPSWDTASKKRIEDNSPEHDMEMAHLENKDGMVKPEGTAGKGGYSQISSQPPTPRTEFTPSSYGGSDHSNSYGAAPSPYRPSTETAAGGMAGSTFDRTSPTRGDNTHSNNNKSTNRPVQRTSSPQYTNMGQFSPINPSPSPYSERPPPGAFKDSYSSQSPSASQVPTAYGAGPHSHPGYTPYTYNSSTSTPYAPSIRQTDSEMPQSLLQPGRRPAPGSWGGM